MSRHVIILPSASGTANVRVGLEYERQLGIVLCQVHTADEAMYPIYLSALDLPRMRASCVEDFAEPLAALGIELPRAVVDNVNWDIKARAGNLIYTYDASGRLESLQGDIRTLGPMIHNTAHLYSTVLEREVLVALGIQQSGNVTRVFSYIGEPDEDASGVIDTSGIGTARDTKVIYCSMSDSDRLRAARLEEVLSPLSDYGITMPPAMIEAVRLQLDDCRGESFDCHYSAEGAIIDCDRGLDMCF